MAEQDNGNRTSTAEKPPPKQKRQPEMKIGPFANGVGACIWLNSVETEEGTRQLRSITINPRRYFDRESNQWKDAPSYNPADLPALIFCLQKAQEYVYETPLPGQTAADASINGQLPGEEIPF
jgi:hypothetical protein